MFLKRRLNLKRLLFLVAMIFVFRIIVGHFFTNEDDFDDHAFLGGNIILFDSTRYLKEQNKVERISFNGVSDDRLVNAKDSLGDTEMDGHRQTHLKITEKRMTNAYKTSSASEVNTFPTTVGNDENIVNYDRQTELPIKKTGPTLTSSTRMLHDISSQEEKNNKQTSQDLNGKNYSTPHQVETSNHVFHSTERDSKETTPVLGKINVYTWKDICLKQDSYNLFWNPLFPKLPYKGYFMDKLQDDDWIRKGIARRLVGYLHVPRSGFYTFDMSARDGLELMLFRSDFTSNDVILRFGILEEDILEQRPKIGRFDLYKKASPEVKLEQGQRYPLDIVHTAVLFGRIEIRIKERNDPGYSIIDSMYLSPYQDTMDLNAELVDAYFPSKESPLRKKFNEDKRFAFGDKIPFNSRTCSTGLRKCDYKPTYLFQGEKLELYYGQQYLGRELIYPEDNIGFYKETRERILDNITATNIAKEVFHAISDANNGKFILKHIVHVEQNNERQNGKRYLVELDIQNKDDNKIYRFSEYFHKPSQDKPLCLPEIYKTWRNDATVYLVCAIRNQRQWVRYLIKSLEGLIERTNDQNLHLVVADFHSEDIDVKKLLEKSKLKFTYISLEGNFSKVKALNEGVKRVPDNDSIIFVMDLQLQIPDHIFDQARKHTIQGIMTYCPILIRLQCGEHPEYTKLAQSIWMDIGYGMMSIYKSDWDRIGGMNEEMFKHKWGGEDWEFVDRVVLNRLELVHQRLPGFYHIYHSTTGTWDGTKLFK